MNTTTISTSTVNAVLDQISSVMAAAKRQGTCVSTDFLGDNFYCICMQENLNRVIDLSNDDAVIKLKGLLNTLYSIVKTEGAA